MARVPCGRCGRWYEDREVALHGVGEGCPVCPGCEDEPPTPLKPKCRARDPYGDPAKRCGLPEGHEGLHEAEDSSAAGVVALRIECTKCGPSPTKPNFEATIPIWLASGLLLAFHSAHEGHPLRITADGVTYEPGVLPGGVPAPR